MAMILVSTACSISEGDYVSVFASSGAQSLLAEEAHIQWRDDREGPNKGL